MFLAGLPLALLFAIFGTAGLITLGLYILKLRRRAVPVAFARLWDRVLKDRESSELFSRLKRWLSFLLQLLLLLLLVLALGDPRPAESSREARSVVVLLDNSASMGATDATPSRFEEGRAKLRELVQGLKVDDQMLIGTLGAKVTPLSGLTSDTTELLAALEKAALTDTEANIQAGLWFAHDVLRGKPNPEVILVSDGAFGELPQNLPSLPRVSFVSVGKEQGNVAVTQLSARRYPLDKSRYESLLTVENLGKKSAAVELSLLGDGKLIDVSRLTLGPEQKLPRVFKDLAGVSQKLEARVRVLEGEDYLAADNHAFALIPERRRAKVLVVTTGNTYLEAALLLDEYLDVTVIAPKAYPRAGDFDVTIFDGVAPARAPKTGAAFYLNPPEEGSPVPLGKSIESFGFDSWDRKSSILRFIAPEDVQVARGRALKPGPSDRVVAASDLGPILVSGISQGQRYVVLGFDPKASDLVLRVAWPLLILNVIDTFIEQDTEYQSSYRTGETWRLRVQGAVETASLGLPDRSLLTVPVRKGRAEIFGDKAGFYQLSWAGSEPIAFAANLNTSAESHIEPRRELSVGAIAASPPSGFSSGIRRHYWGHLLLAVVILSCLEWVTYHRRVTV